MALEEIKKIEIVTHKAELENIVDALERLGSVEVVAVSEEELEPRALDEEELKAIRNSNLAISQIEFILDFIRQNGRKKPSFIKTLIKDKYEMSIDEFLSFEEKVDLHSIYEHCSKLEKRLVGLLDRRAELIQQRDELENWLDLNIHLDEVRDGQRYGVVSGKMPPSKAGEALDQLNEKFSESAGEIVSLKESAARVLIIFTLGLKDEVLTFLSDSKFEPVILPSYALTPAQRCEQIEDELREVEAEIEKLRDEVEDINKSVPDLVILREYHLNKRKKIESLSAPGVTRRAALIKGWVCARHVPKVKKALEKVTDAFEIDISDPAPDENVPVLLRNNRFVKPFETLTKLYGLPHSAEFDPTVIIAVSFTIFFGFCIGDVGYGACLIIAFYLLKRLLPIGKNVRNLFTVMSLGSAFAMVMGVLTGSWFGIETAKLPLFLKKLAVFDPLTEPLPVMGLCMGLGILHMLAGTIVEFRDNWRTGEKKSALIDQGLVLLMFVAFAIAAVLVVTKKVNTKGALLFPGVVILGMLVFFGRDSKSIAGKVINGIYETYNTVVGWLGDTVSYVRLYALGLATFVIGWVINTLSGMIMGILPVVGFIIMLAVMLAGHTLNVLINLLGAFVHPLRLHFVEFFGKFYEDGGREFRPLGIESKIIYIKEYESEE